MNSRFTSWVWLLWLFEEKEEHEQFPEVAACAGLALLFHCLLFSFVPLLFQFFHLLHLRIPSILSEEENLPLFHGHSLLLSMIYFFSFLWLFYPFQVLASTTIALAFCLQDYFCNICFNWWPFFYCCCFLFYFRMRSESHLSPEGFSCIPRDAAWSLTFLLLRVVTVIACTWHPFSMRKHALASDICLWPFVTPLPTMC